MNRRDLLKYFGIGTIIAPVTGGSVPIVAKLIEEPKIIEVTEVPQANPNARCNGVPMMPGYGDLEVSWRDKQTGIKYYFTAQEAYLLESFVRVRQPERFDITTHSQSYHQYSSININPSGMGWELKGQITGHSVFCT